MIALSIRQPWAWHILHSGKDIENRSWATSFRGRILVHAGKSCTRDEYENGADPLWDVEDGPMICTPPLKELPRGGIVSSVEIVDCVNRSDSMWFSGDFGFVLRDPQVLPFVAFRGALGFFDVPSSAMLPLPPNV